MNTTITGQDWKASITASRNAPNSILQRWITKWAFVGLLLAPGSSEAAPEREPLDISRMVAVLKMKENGPADNPWQITPGVWNAYSKVPIKSASPAEHRRVAWMFVAALCRQCSSLDWIITPETIALLYKAGYGTIIKNEVTPADRLYAQHVSNLYYDTK